MNRKSFGTTKQGEAVYTYEISNGNGLKAVLTDFGAAAVSVFTPDKNGKEIDVLLGRDEVSGYEGDGCYFGATVGPNANRIANARCTIDGVVYELDANNNENNLHSGYNTLAWKVWEVKEHTASSITFAISCPHLAQGFPGNASYEVTYEATDDQAIAIRYRAVADQKTTFNMTNHSYFNLNGGGDIYGHVMQLSASAYTPIIDAKAIPTGEIAPVEGTPFDFRSPKTIGQDIHADNEQLAFGHGYDHNWVLDKKTDGLEIIGSLYAPESGIYMEILTDLPGIQIYSGNFVDTVGKGGAALKERSGIAMETQIYPDSINQPDFPNAIYEAGEVYQTQTIYRFSVK